MFHLLLPIKEYLQKLLQISFCGIWSDDINCQNQLFQIKVLNFFHQTGRHCAICQRLMLSYQLLSTLRAIVKKREPIKMSSAIFGHTSRIYRMIARIYYQLRNLPTTTANLALLEFVYFSQLKRSTLAYHFPLLLLSELLLRRVFSKQSQMTLPTI